ncbi:hypothetical protein L2E82_38260 [Cichorium intybus]|uniref:Uncharacterized protein n=1 Tax=Cichorium intybus TaxID=13427 RepID=A0ACB9AHF4_CICIN|nr:hypothetical protein L2E82_38260 [Cichorium intybus]
MYILACPHKALLSFPHVFSYAPLSVTSILSLRISTLRNVQSLPPSPTFTTTTWTVPQPPLRRSRLLRTPVPSSPIFNQDDSIQDAASRIAAELRGVPDLIIGNYSDGNLVASLLSYKIGVT